ncbi:3'-5' exoribonuclease [Williamsoniiplasma somnilux]|uniref:3'-5' exoribonuclease n=1 Tax=Williamsoniiplasma somnilux TaxID=215578 RepID=A0A2K8NY06_9MOLU|nr:HD domain-containing protein [Williamsoniiplasma somnilux]ATZ18624.1 3'-5' exoribonuclease [Williamsoniiplasma somnilux]
MKKIKSVTAEDNNIEILARIEKVVVSTGSNGSGYMIIHLTDKTGRLEARKWTISEQDKEIIKANKFLYTANATASEYRNVLQLKINDYKIIDKDELSNYGLTFDDFFISAPVNIEKEYFNLLEILNNLENNTYKQITLDLIEKYKNDFLIYPAAMNIHHNVRGGLFWHSYTLVKNALAIKDNYKYANIDWELVICGSILHDIGKIIEIIDESGVDYSLEGKLLGHISIGNAEIAKIAEQLNLYKLEDGSINKDVTLLQHMILASHGKNEYGSPTEPVIIEAIILSTFDSLDARIYRVNDDLNKVENNEWTPRIMSEEGKMFLNHFSKNKK